MRRALFLTSAAVLALGLAACKSEPEAEGKAKAAIRPVVSVLVEPRREQVIGFSGTIQPRFQTDRGFRVLGRLISRHVDVGDSVAPGQVLAQIDPVLLDLAVRGSEADLAKAQAQLANATASEGRIRALFEKQVAIRPISTMRSRRWRRRRRASSRHRPISPRRSSSAATRRWWRTRPAS